MKKKCVFCQFIINASFVCLETVYFKCSQCGGIFIDPSLLLSPIEERSRYLLHKNSLTDQGYRTYLENFWNGFENFLSGLEGPKTSLSSVLDWGSGPEPSFASLLSEKGFNVQFYDPFFAPKLPSKGVLFDCITCLEVAEHFYEPFRDFSVLSSFLTDGGYLALATHILPLEKESFDSWWYRQDSTHVSFYTEQALRSIGERTGLTLVGYAGNHTWVFSKDESFRPALPL